MLKREELKEVVDKDFGLLELATNARRDVKKGTGNTSIGCSICNLDGQMGINRIRLTARMSLNDSTSA